MTTTTPPAVFSTADAAAAWIQRREAERGRVGKDADGIMGGSMIQEETGLCVIVPMLPPTVNHSYRPNGRGGRILTDEAQTFRQVVALEIRDMLMRTGWQLPAGRLEFELRLTYGTRVRTDIDNRIKAALDACALALGFDDQRIDRVVIERAGYEARRPLCEMIVREFAR